MAAGSLSLWPPWFGVYSRGPGPLSPLGAPDSLPPEPPLSPSLPASDTAQILHQRLRLPLPGLPLSDVPMSGAPRDPGLCHVASASLGTSVVRPSLPELSSVMFTGGSITWDPDPDRIQNSTVVKPLCRAVIEAALSKRNRAGALGLPPSLS